MPAMLVRVNYFPESQNAPTQWKRLSHTLLVSLGVCRRSQRTHYKRLGVLCIMLLCKPSKQSNSMVNFGMHTHDEYACKHCIVLPATPHAPAAGRPDALPDTRLHYHPQAEDPPEPICRQWQQRR